MKRKFPFHAGELPPMAGIKSPAAGPVPKLAVLLAAALCVAPVSSQGGSPAMRWSERIEVADGKAIRGPWFPSESVWHFVDDPSVAIADQGNAGVVWVDHSRTDL